MPCELKHTCSSASSQSATSAVFLPSSELGSGQSAPEVLVPEDKSESKHGACADVAGKIKVELPPPVLGPLKRGSAASRRSRIKREVIIAVSLHGLAYTRGARRMVVKMSIGRDT